MHMRTIMILIVLQILAVALLLPIPLSHFAGPGVDEGF